ncbi:hypothetical protein [Aquamicrobium soli]|uniref:DUF551 domain-containing protein n=1 Tax=Aquamicrobium soli TaxID=1811518 RepID=A0ABV7KEK3_9HYPH
MTHPKTTTPTNPAQVTDAMVEAARKIIWGRDLGHLHGDDLIRAALTAAIGADSEEDTESQWRDLALQFDGHRIQAMCLLRAIAADKAGKAEIEVFLSAPPLSGEQVLADRIAAIGAGGQAVQDTWFTDRALPVKAMSGDVEDNRVLRLHFRRPVTDDDRKAMCDALNLHQASLTHPAPSGQAVAVKALQELLAKLDKCPRTDRGFHWQASDWHQRENLTAYGEWASALYWIIENQDTLVSAIAHPVQPGWRDMSSAPKDGTWLIAYRPGKGGGYLDRVVIVRWDDEVSAWVWPDQPFDVYEDDYAERLAAHGLGDHIDPFEDNAFTHWMPLPAAPQPKGE